MTQCNVALARSFLDSAEALGSFATRLNHGCARSIWPAKRNSVASSLADDELRADRQSLLVPMQRDGHRRLPGGVEERGKRMYSNVF